MSEQEAERIDRLFDAIDLVKQERREEAYQLLRQLIQEDNNFEAAWLWMSVVVDSLDQSSLCLDNVLRVNPGNSEAAGALYRIRGPELLLEKRRGRLRLYRDFAFSAMWALVVVLLYAMLFTLM